MYRSLSDNDLASYIAFLDSDAGKRFRRVVVDGYGKIIEDLVIESQKDLIEQMKKQVQAQNEDNESCIDEGDGFIEPQAASH